MRKLWMVSLICCVVSLAQAAVVDDFQSYELGALQAPWVGTTGSIAGEKWGDKYLSAYSPYMVLSSPILNGDTETTVFFRTYATTAKENTAFGLSDSLTPSGWGANEAYIQWNETALMARNAGTGVKVWDTPPVPGWFNVWLVVNNSTDTYDVYVNQGTADATAADLKGDNFVFRNGTASNDLVSLHFEGGSVIGVDDIHIWSGTVLTNPAKPPLPPAPTDPAGHLVDYDVENANFTAPGYVIKTDYDQIPGWTSDDTTPVDSGTENDGGADGDGWSAFVGWADEPAYQITSTIIAADTPYTLELMMQNSYGASTGEIYLFYVNDAGQKVILATKQQTGLTGTWIPVSVTAIVSAGSEAIGKNLGIMIDSVDTDGYGFVGYDDVKLYSYDIHGAINPNPDGTVRVNPSSVSLAWTKSNDPNLVAQYLYYYVGSGDPNLLEYVNAGRIPLTATAESYPVNLGYDQYVLWRVDTGLDWGAAEPAVFYGQTWYFETLSAEAVIGAMADTEVEKGTTATFTGTFVSVSAPSVKWHYSRDPNIVLSGGDYTVTTTHVGGNDWTTQLQIANTDLADQVNYYFEVANNGGIAESEWATLRVNALLAEYRFDGDLTDNVGNYDGRGKTIDGLATPDSTLAADAVLSFVPGHNGSNQAVVINPKQYIEISDPNAFPTVGNGVAANSDIIPVTHGGGLDRGSILAWIKPVLTGEAVVAVVANFNETDSTACRFDIRSNGQVGSFLRGTDTGNMWEFSNFAARPGTNIYDGNWHMVALTWDVRSGCMVYVDGTVAEFQAENTPNATFGPWNRPVLIGASRQSTRTLLSSMFTGAIDNLRFYNYQVAHAVIAQEYYDYSGLLPCATLVFEGSQFDVVQTGTSWCRVDMEDFAEFASAWLSNGFLLLP